MHDCATFNFTGTQEACVALYNEQLEVATNEQNVKAAQQRVQALISKICSKKHKPKCTLSQCLDPKDCGKVNNSVIFMLEHCVTAT
jgi:hypothetical protein